MVDSPPTQPEASALQREHLALERQRQETEARFRARELELRQGDLDLRQRELSRSQWHNPLFAGLVVAIIGIIGNIVVSYINGVLEREKLEQQAIQADLRHGLEQEREAKKAEFEFITQALTKGDRERTYQKLVDFIDLGLVSDPEGQLRGQLLAKIAAPENVVASVSTVVTSGPSTRTGTLPHANLGIIGDLELLRPLTSAITKVLSEQGRAEFVAPDLLRDLPEERARGVVLRTAHVEYRTKRRRYAQAICGLDLSDCAQSIITGAVQMDGAILAVSVDRGVTDAVRQFVKLADAVSVPALVVFVDLQDGLSSRGASLETEVRNLLNANSFPGSNVPVIQGSIRAALRDDGDGAIQDLLDLVDATVPTPPKPADLPFLLPVEDVFSISGRGTVVTGRVEPEQLDIWSRPTTAHQLASTRG